MAVKRKSFKESLQSKELNYCNDFFELKNTPNIFTDSFSYNSYNALTDVNDIKTNNFSNLFLSKKQLNEDWLSVKEKDKPELNIVSTISFRADNTSDPTNPGVWLYFDKTYTFWDTNLQEAPYALTLSRPASNIYNYFFYIEYVSDTECRISHNFGEMRFYLALNENQKIYFTAEYNPDTCIFGYNLQDTELQLYKTVTITEEGKTTTTVFTLAHQEVDGVWSLVLSDDLSININNTIYLNKIENNLELYNNNSYVGYDQSKYITAINNDKSAFFIKGQALFHHQYNKNSGINFVPLKNNLTYQGQYSRGDNLTISFEEYPDVNYRNYASIQSGLNQEHGNDTITLNYLFNDQVYTIEDGDILTFRIPSIAENGGKNPLWPYKTLNIADSKFIKSGAFSSEVPYFADKVYRYQGPNTIITDSDGKPLSPDNGTYLCTWLYQIDETYTPVWLDRYYYPDKISRKEALTSPHFEESFENIIDKNYDTDEVTQVIKENTYFDKVSDLVFEPNNEYKYARLSSEMVNEVIEQLEPNRIENVEDKDGRLAYLSDEIDLDNKHALRIDHSLFNKTNALNFNADLYITNGKRIGLQIFGTDYTSGLNIQNRKDVAPYHYYATGKVLYLLNNNFEIKHSFDLYSKYHDVINKFILGDIFDDVIAISNLYLYIFTYDLSLKSKISYADINGINDVIIDGIKGNLLNYPYSDGAVQVTYSEQTFHYNDKFIHAKENLGFLRDDTVQIDYTEPEVAVFFETNISRIISTQNALLYKNNLYVPYEQNIIKFIFVPDSKKDNFPEEDMAEYPCKVRMLDYDEYFCNYLRTTADSQIDEEPTFENGFIEVENKIKNIYINNVGQIFGFNFDKLAVAPDDDTVYGLYGWDKYIDSGGWYWLYNQSLSKIQSSVITSKFAEFASDDSIDWVRMNEEGMMCLIRGFSKMSDERRLEIYDKAKKRFYQYYLTDYEEIYSVDTFNYIDSEYNEHSVFTILARISNRLYRIEYQCESGTLNEDQLDLPVEKNERFYETTNSNVIMRHANENKLYFNLFLPTNYLYDYCESIVWDLSDIQTGWYNINVHVNLDMAIFEVKINDIPYENRNNSETFLPYVNSNGTIFDTTYYIGQLGKKYGTTMNNILSDVLTDPYMCKNSKMENIKIYTKSLSYHEYQAIRLDGRPINTISLTLPCGSRSNIDEIVRYFKYVPPSAISNKVKINISGTGLTTKGEFEMLKKEILTVLENNKDCLVDVNEIEFI